MKKNKKIIFLCILIILIIIISLIVYKKTYIPSDKKIFKEVKGHVNKDNTFVDNQLVLTFNENTEFKIIKKIVWNLKATIDGTEESNIGMYKITFNNKTFKSIKEADNYCDKIIKKYDQIENCIVDEIIPIDDCTKGPC